MPSYQYYIRMYAVFFLLSLILFCTFDIGKRRIFTSLMNLRCKIRTKYNLFVAPLLHWEPLNYIEKLSLYKRVSIVKSIILPNNEYINSLFMDLFMMLKCNIAYYISSRKYGWWRFTSSSQFTLLSHLDTYVLLFEANKCTIINTS